MKRLTKVYDCETPKRIAVTKGKSPQTWSETTAVGKALLRLAAYEDTGLEPKTLNEFAPFLLEMKMNIGAMRHLKELLQAEKDGRLVVLPCRVKDTVYITEAAYDRERFSGERVVSAQIDHVTIGGTTGMPVFDLCTETGGWYYSMEPNQFYLTHEEAEAALKKREESDNEAD